MVKKYFLYCFTAGFVVGIYISRFATAQTLIVFLMTSALFSAGAFFIKSTKKYFILIWIIMIAVALGFWRFNVVNVSTQLGDFFGKKVLIRGTVYAEPDVGLDKTRLKISINEFSFESTKIFPTENILASISKLSEFQIGDEVEIFGKLDRPENFMNDNGIEFDYVNFLGKEKIFSVMYQSSSKLIARKNNKILNRFLYSSKNYFLKKLSTVLPSPEAELMGGLLLGVKKSLGKELEDAFRRVGLIHVVVLSGYNITIIVIAVFSLLSFFPRFLKYFLGITFVVCFAIMVGSGATVIRASIMTILAIVGKVSSREYDINRSLFFAGIIMVIQNPLILFFDPSFQLSFLATLGLVNLSTHVSAKLQFVTEKFGAREIVASTLSTQIAVLPMILKMTGEISIVALPVNLIVLPLIPMTMFLGFVTGILVIIWWPLGFIFGYLPNLFLSFELWMVETFSRLSFATAEFSAPSNLATILFYCAIIIFFYYRPIQVCKKIINVIRLSAREVISNK